MSHSKRNTSRAVFTSYERDLARRSWGSASARLSRESFLPFASCGLCLSPAADPVACGARGDVFCRECALGNLLAQRREAKRAERARAADERDRRDAQARDDDEARARAVRDFEMTLQGLDDNNGGGRRSATTTRTSTSTTLAPGWGHNAARSHSNGNGRSSDIPPPPREEDDDRPYKDPADHKSENDEARRPAKRKLESLDANELARAAAEADRAKARRLLDSEKAEAASKAALPSFWTPSMAPSGAQDQNKDKKQDKKKGNGDDKAGASLPVCPASREGDPHPYSLHTLVTINFTEEVEEDSGRAGGGGGERNKQTDQGQKRRICPACRKGLSNASKAVLAKPCGHVLCRSCVDKFMRPSTDPHVSGADAHGGGGNNTIQCYVCEADLTDRPPHGKTDDGKKKKDKIRPGLVELRSEGTGFSAAGANQVKKAGVGFQC
ncbi:hypothetical protein SLS62_008231 [Diatrype stigma]|uniref:RING-type domain-containing protein n=1 Tax=Diatrype stigma TaxID=117547 RepID=A0AAN9ULW9_9PEZI